LVAGANNGLDCKLFIDKGASEVHGVDVVDTVGADYPHPRVTYHRASIEKTDLPSGYFDLVFAVATLEHVPDVNAAFAEMARLTKSGGYIYSLAAPLWRSPYGHHMACFHGHPWVHLTMTRDEIIQYAKANGINGQNGHDIEFVVDYMLNPDYFNMTPAAQYVAACEALTGVELVENLLVPDHKETLNHDLGKRALRKGFDADDLLWVSHTLVARKV
jgi:SAM-dependent methyltransferase